jgi:hypothetical protein
MDSYLDHFESDHVQSLKSFVAKKVGVLFFGGHVSCSIFDWVQLQIRLL